MEPSGEAKALRAEALRLASRVETYVVAVLGQQTSYQNEGHRIALHALSVRMLQTFRAVFKLVEEGLHDGAAAVLRSLVEQHFVFTALLDKPELMARACKDEEAEQRKALSGLKKLPSDFRSETMTNDALDAAIAQRTSGKFDVCYWAQQAGLEDMYQTLWRHLSFNAHGALHAINDYVAADDDGTITGIRPNILAVRSIDFVLTAIGILMASAGAIDRQPMTEQRRAQREVLGADLGALRERYYVLALHGA